VPALLIYDFNWLDIREFPLSDDTDFFIVACDGLWDKLSNEAAIKFVNDALAEGKPAKQIAQDIVMEAYKQGSQDNIRLLVITQTQPEAA
jgi:serine/threonine protein phosphatase PrpC